MNTLALIKKQILKSSNAQSRPLRFSATRYRGVDCQVHQAGEESHGTFCYRGRTYTK